MTFRFRPPCYIDRHLMTILARCDRASKGTAISPRAFTQQIVSPAFRRRLTHQIVRLEPHKRKLVLETRYIFPAHIFTGIIGRLGARTNFVKSTWRGIKSVVLRWHQRARSMI